MLAIYRKCEHNRRKVLIQNCEETIFLFATLLHLKKDMLILQLKF